MRIHVYSYVSTKQVTLITPLPFTIGLLAHAYNPGTLEAKAGEGELEANFPKSRTYIHQ